MACDQPVRPRSPDPDRHGAPASKCLVIPNGIQYERFCDIPLKPEDGWVDIGAVVRLAPIKDVKTLIHAFSELSNRVDNVRLHILGGVDDQDYADECYELVKQLEVKNLEFTGRVNVVEYMRKLDFTVLTSISEGQPLSVLESFAAARPCVTTDVAAAVNCWKARKATTSAWPASMCLRCTARALPAPWNACARAASCAKPWAKWDANA